MRTVDSRLSFALRYRFALACLFVIPFSYFAEASKAVAEAAGVKDRTLAISKSPESDTIRLSPRATTGPKPRDILAPSSDEIENGIRRGVDFLLQDQNTNGSWGNATQTKKLNIFAPVPGAHHAFRAAVTGLVVSALIESEDQRPEVRKAIDRGQVWLYEHLPQVRRANGKAIYNVWAHAYGIQALVDLHDWFPENDPRRDKISSLVAEQIELLDRYESVDGGWAYYDKKIPAKAPSTSSSSFTTATVLVALDATRRLDVSLSENTPPSSTVRLPEKMIDNAVHSVQRQRKLDFTYLYGETHKFRPMRSINRSAGSLGRSQACNIALRLFGDRAVTDQVLETWLDRLYARNGWLSVGRKKPVPHESFAKVAGYFYYYGHYYAARCVEALPSSRRPHFQEHLAYILLPLQETDGSWWDYPLYDYHQQYGTAMAISSLVRCRQPK